MPDRTIPLAEEKVEIGKRTRTTGTVRVEVETHEIRQPVEAELLDDVVEVKRVPVGRMVDGPVPDRREADGTLVIPVLEEVLVVEKRLRLVEEIHLVRRRTARTVREDVALRKQDAKIERQ